MTERLALAGAKPHELLVVRVLEPSVSCEAELHLPDLVAKTTIYERHSGEVLRLGAYFSELARQWRGWEGGIAWEALGLDLLATHDGLGHVLLEATLANDYAAAEHWTVTGRLHLEAGALDQISRDAALLDRL